MRQGNRERERERERDVQPTFALEIILVNSQDLKRWIPRQQSYSYPTDATERGREREREREREERG